MIELMTRRWPTLAQPPMYRPRPITQYEIKKDKDGYKSDARFRYIYMGDADDLRCINAIIVLKRRWYILSRTSEGTSFFLSHPWPTKRHAIALLHGMYHNNLVCLIKTDTPIYLPQTIFKMPIEKEDR